MPIDLCFPVCELELTLDPKDVNSTWGLLWKEKFKLKVCEAAGLQAKRWVANALYDVKSERPSNS